MHSLTRDKTEPNLLVKLQRWARLKQQDENFTTEAFAHLLEYLFKHDPDSGLKLFGVLTGWKKGGWLSEEKWETVEFTPQYQTKHEGRPDIRIAGDEFCIFVEVKVDAAVKTSQLKKYQKALGEENWLNSRKKLVLLAKTKPSKKEVPSGVKTVLWGQIVNELRQLRKKCRSEYGRFLINQFVGFIDRPTFFIERGRTELSEELKAYLDRKRDKSIFESPFKRVDIKEAKLDKLNDLLELMLEAAGDLDDWRSKRFVASKSGWVGINLNNQLYWVYLLIEDPEVIYFQRFRENTIKDRTTYGIEIEKHKAGSKRCRGYIEDGRYRYWQDDLDLETTFFYSEESSRDDRLKILKDFFKDSLEYADKTWGRGR